MPGREKQKHLFWMATNAGQPWTEKDVRWLAEMRSNGLKTPLIALTLRRSVYAVYNKEQKLRSGK